MLVVLVALVGWGIESAVVWPGFQPKSIAVTGDRVVSPTDVRKAAAISGSENIWLINPWAIRARVSAIPYVATASLDRAWPNRVRVDITERRPEACIRGNKGVLMMIDPTARVLEYGCKMSVVYDVPRLRATHLGATITDAELARLRSIAATFAAAGMHVRRVATDRDDGAVVERADGLVFLLGDDTDLTAKVQLIRPIVDAARGRGPALAQIDLRAIETPVARYRVTRHDVQNRAHKL